VDKEKFDKLTPEQKEKFKSDQEKARDTALEGVKAEKEVLEKAKDVAGTVARYTTAVTIGAIEGGPPKALRNAVASAVYEITKDNAKKEGEK
jgi:hypothetical protein